MWLNHVVKGVVIQTFSPLSHCESCIIAKHPCLPFHSSETEHASSFLDLIHSDDCGPIPTITPHSKSYFIIFLNNHTHTLDLQLLVTKDQALDAWCTLCACWKNMLNLKVKIFRLDNGGEFLNAAFMTNLGETGVQHQHSAPYAYQQNGKSERVMCTIKGCIYAMLDFAHLPMPLWGEVAFTAAYLFNCTELCALPAGKTPYEMMHGLQPNLAHLCVFSVHCFVRIPQTSAQAWSEVMRGNLSGLSTWCKGLVLS